MKTKLLSFILCFLWIVSYGNNVKTLGDCEPECPDDFTVQADMNDQYTIPDYVANGMVTIFGPCEGASVVQTPAPRTVVGLGEIEIIVTVTLNGDEEECDFDVTVESNIGGGDCMVQCPADFSVAADANGEYSIPSYFGEGLVTISGDCFGAIIDQTPEAGTIVGLGQTTVIVEVEAGGVTDDCDFILTVTDQLGINDFDANKIQMYPNPASDNVVINTPIRAATIYTLQGQTVNVIHSSTIPVGHLKAGMYLVVIETENGKTTKRLLIE